MDQVGWNGAATFFTLFGWGSHGGEVNPRGFFGGSAVHQKRTDGSAPAPLVAVKNRVASHPYPIPSHSYLGGGEKCGAGAGERPSSRAGSQAQASGRPSRRRRAAVRLGVRPSELVQSSRRAAVRPGVGFQELVLFYAPFHCATRSGEQMLEGIDAREEEEIYEPRSGLRPSHFLLPLRIFWSSAARQLPSHFLLPTLAFTCTPLLQLHYKPVMLR
jgi:hypothetical protein